MTIHAAEKYLTVENLSILDLALSKLTGFNHVTIPRPKCEFSRNTL